jgi:ABC-2 type transport system ATP-binding protein
MSEAIRTENLHKSFVNPGFTKGEKVKVLKGLSFNVETGQSTAILGPNGAGKTTLMKQILGISQPDSGLVEILGHAAGSDFVRSKIGYVSENPMSLNFMNKSDFLDFFMNLNANNTNSKYGELIDGLVGKISEKTKVSGFSKGMLQRLNFARILENDPEIVFLDEPVIGLDPIGQLRISAMVKKLIEFEKTVLINTHSVDFALEVASRILVLHQGEIVGDFESGEQTKSKITELFLSLESERS